jgi:hypothetical protein
MTDPTALRHQLRAAGFCPLPLRGKVPFQKDWQKRTEPSSADIDAWRMHYPDAQNTGLLTRLMPTLDADILDPFAVEAIEMLVRERFEERGYILARTGRPPKCAFPFRTNTPFPKITGKIVAPDGSTDQKIELLCDGQQMVVDGIHPDTRQPYHWNGAGAPGAVKYEELPYLHPEEAQNLVDDVVELLCRSYGYSRGPEHSRKNKANGGDRDGDGEPQAAIEKVTAALAVIPNDEDWDGWNNIGMATWLATGGSAIGFAAFDTWSRKSLKYDAGTTAAKWAAYFKSPPTKIGAGTLFHLASEARPGWRDETSAAVSLGEWNAGADPGTIPPRQWLLANQFCCGFISSIVSAGGGGKSALRLLQYISLALGRPLCGQHVFRRSRVLLVSLEDDDDELQRRIKAVLDHYQIDRSELDGWLFCAAPKLVKLAQLSGKTRVVGPLEQQLRDAIGRRKPDLIGLDPFVKTHALEENSSGDMDFVCDLLARFAIEFKIAVDSPHHVHKGTLMPGDADSGRGSSGIRDAGRLVYTLTPMSEQDAGTFGISEEDRCSYIRLDRAKVNLIGRSNKPDWFQLVSVSIGNPTDEYPAGDSIQVVVPWQAAQPFADIPTATLNAILDDIERGLPNGQRYSNAPSAGSDRAVVPVAQKHLPNKTEGQCRVIIHKWLDSGLLYKEDYDDPIQRKPRSGLRVNDAKRPGSTL